MKRARAICYFVLALIPLFSSQVFAVEVAPRISDREIIEGLADIKRGQACVIALLEKNGLLCSLLTP